MSRNSNDKPSMAAQGLSFLFAGAAKAAQGVSNVFAGAANAIGGSPYTKETDSAQIEEIIKKFASAQKLAAENKRTSEAEHKTAAFKQTAIKLTSTIFQVPGDKKAAVAALKEAIQKIVEANQKLAKAGQKLAEAKEKASRRRIRLIKRY